LQSRARLRGENYGAWRRAKTAVDVIGDIARAALVEKPLEAAIGFSCRVSAVHVAANTSLGKPLNRNDACLA